MQDFASLKRQMFQVLVWLARRRACALARSQVAPDNLLPHNGLTLLHGSTTCSSASVLRCHASSMNSVRP